MRALPGVLLVLLAVAGCANAIQGTPVPAAAAAPNRELVDRYFTDLNEAGKEGYSAQRDFLRRTQHPDFTADCDLGGLTLRIEPALSTLRADPKWKPEKSTKHPRGDVYVVGVSVRIRRDSATLAEQIGSQRVVVLDGKTYGFTPCPTR
ncbi:hypothetical protein [Actinokineospora diospyrosa]|uniref:Uncharacterized protein n=1 Tax=Actinokineospora diospyrosa TaxID=103728 RepID=A0ABT1IK79_9PSEU|nr:hypothetical protein [Actinokineospora diospyrosa]MCP2273057.1 hypothetical protein [Actinokineospora diospyrosa]